MFVKIYKELLGKEVYRNVNERRFFYRNWVERWKNNEYGLKNREG
jgi:hypothetical protein